MFGTFFCATRYNLRNGSFDLLRFWHAAEGRQARECVPCVARPAFVRQERRDSAESIIRVRKHARRGAPAPSV